MDLLNTVNDIIWTYLLIGALILSAIYFTVRTRGVQFMMFGEMLRLLRDSGQKHDDPRDSGISNSRKVSSFQALSMSIASRVGTGNLAGVATAIALGGPGAVFWMWVITLLGSVNAFVESTLAQLYKIKGPKSFIGGPAYYISRGIGQRWWAILFAILITVTFGFAYNSVQANTITAAVAVFGWDAGIVGVIITLLALVIICGGVHRISRFSQIVVPVMAIGYVLLAVVIIAINITRFPEIICRIVSCAFTGEAAVGGGVGMAVMMGVKRGLFSNEAGEGSAPNAAATAAVSHPVKQGLIQTLAVYIDTLLICTCTAFIILCSDVFSPGLSGISLTQAAIDSALGFNAGSAFVAVAVFFFAFTSIIANYYYGEINLWFITPSRGWLYFYRLCVGAMVMLGSVSSLDFVWALADLTMALMTICNLSAIIVLGRYALILLSDYRRQLSSGLDPEYRSSTIPSIADVTTCWK